ncbi:MAG: ABC transporter permease [Candidatus Eremiobacteraeota bacterium]|nr:ABC transporter permease [Candidatus Eremiobacteraeota bacterium]MBC5826140.1 ABC transporter permease [Candidatus Eremiobacteraeota bacterium]
MATDVWRRFARNRLSLIGLAVVAGLVFCALLAGHLTRYDPNAIDPAIIGSAQPPSAQHLFGTDVDGRDYFTRMLFGARISLEVGFSAMIVAVTLGTLYGVVSAFYGGIVDAAMMRFVDMMLSFPTFFLILTVEALTNNFSFIVIMLVIGLLSWMGVARLVRGQVLSLRERDFVSAARAMGADDGRIIGRHLLPNALAPVIVAATLAIGDNILTEAGLSYLGVGVQIPTPSWGNSLQKALDPDVQSAPWLIFIPGALIVLTVVAFNFIGEGLRDALDPKTRGGP